MLLGFDWNSDEVTFCEELDPRIYGGHAGKVLICGESCYANVYVGF